MEKKIEIVNSKGLESVLEIILCQICLNPTLKAQLCNGCQNLFCSDCIENWKKRSDSCPMRCESSTLSNENKQVKEIRELFKFKCEFCTSEIQLTQYEVHVRKLKCSDCDQEYQYCLEKEHIDNCVVMVDCKCCGTNVNKKQIKNNEKGELNQNNLLEILNEKEKLISNLKLELENKDKIINSLKEFINCKEDIKKSFTVEEEYAMRVSEMNFKLFDKFRFREWNIWQKNDNYAIYYIDEENSLRSIKSVSIVRRPPKVVFDFILSLDNKVKYDPTFESGYIIKELTDEYRLDYQLYKGRFGLISARDFTMIIKKQFNENGESIIFGTSYNSTSIHKRKNIERAELLVGSYVITNLGNSTKVEFYLKNDSKINQILMNYALKNVATCVSKIKEILEKN